MGTLGGDFLSSLPLPEYPPAFPLGADIQGRTLVTRWGYTATSSPEPGQNPCSSSELSGLSLQRSCFGFFGGEGVRLEVDIDFFFLPGLDLFSFLQTESQVSGPPPP